MRIVIATPIYPPAVGGPATYTREIAARLSKRHSISIVAYTDQGEAVPGTTLVSVSTQSLLLVRLINYFFALYAAAKNADVIFAQNAVAAGLPAVLVGMLRRIPVVLKFVGDEAWERAQESHQTHKHLDEFSREPEGSLKIRRMIGIQRYVLGRATRIFTPSAYLREFLTKTYRVDPAKSSVIYNAIEAFGPLEPQARVAYQILTAVRLVSWKGVDGVLRATAILRKSFPTVRLMIAGEGPEEVTLKALAQELGVSDCVTFLGRVSRLQMWEFLQTCAVHVLNSTYEGLPHGVIEGFAAGIPTVATDISGTKEAVYGRQTGLLVQPENPPDLAAAIAQLFEDPVLCAQLVEGGKKLIAEKFSWGTHMTQLEALLREVAPVT